MRTSCISESAPQNFNAFENISGAEDQRAGERRVFVYKNLSYEDNSVIVFSIQLVLLNVSIPHPSSHKDTFVAVSYTHLTLPTILLV